MPSKHGYGPSRYPDLIFIDGRAYYDANDIQRGLLATMDLFRWVAKETAEHLRYQVKPFLITVPQNWSARLYLGRSRLGTYDGA